MKTIHLIALLAAERIDHERRALRLPVREFDWSFEEGSALVLRFVDDDKGIRGPHPRRDRREFEEPCRINAVAIECAQVGVRRLIWKATEDCSAPMRAWRHSSTPWATVHRPCAAEPAHAGRADRRNGSARRPGARQSG